MMAKKRKSKIDQLRFGRKIETEISLWMARKGVQNTIKLVAIWLHWVQHRGNPFQPSHFHLNEWNKQQKKKQRIQRHSVCH